MADRRRGGAPRPSGRRWRPVAVAFAGLALVLCAGCARLPDSGPAGQGEPIDRVAVEPLQAAPPGPRPDAGPEEVVGGFLRAGAGFDNDHAVARSFLVPATSRSWSPERGTLVYADDTSLTVHRRSGALPDGSVRVDVAAPVSGSIDADGTYTGARAGTRATTSFDLARRGGQWRISRVDPDFGLWLPRYEVDRSYSPVQLTYVAAGTRTLVPDLRWFGGPQSGLATLMVRELLAGPPDWLRGALVSGAPDGTRLAVDAVPVADGVAQVDLTAAVLSATPEQRQELWSQLFTTLSQLPGVSGVRLTSGGTPFAVPGVGDQDGQGAASRTLGYSDDVRVTGEPLVLAGDRFERVEASTGQLTASGPVATLPSAAGLATVAAGPSEVPLVGLTDAGTQLVRLRDDARDPLLTGGALVPPSVDTGGFVWSADQSRPGSVLVVDGEAQEPVATRLAPSWLAGRVVRSLDVSRAGDRVAVVSSAADGSRRVDVAGVVRAADHRPTRLTAAIEQGQSLDDARDVAWADRSDLVVIARTAGQPPRPYQLAVGGLTTPLAAVTDPRLVAAGDGMRALYVVDGAGRVLTRSGSGWRVLGAGRSVTVPT